MGLRGWHLLSLVLAALLGGYALATASGIFLAGILPMSRGEAILTGNMLSLIVYSVAIIWAFAVRRPRTVWLALLVPACLMAGTGPLLASLPT